MALATRWSFPWGNETRRALVLWVVLWSPMACSGSPQSSSSTHWLACETNADCDRVYDGGVCVERRCESAAGAPLLRTTVYEEDFGESELSSTALVHELGFDIRNSELQAYTDRSDNVFLEDGQLVIVARAETYGDASFTSGSVEMASSDGFRFGRIEARIKAPLGRGCRAAFWMLPASPAFEVPSCDAGVCYDGDWPAWGDVTIASLQSPSPELVHTALNFGEWDTERQAVVHRAEHATHPVEGGMGEWHVYALEWGPRRMAWFVDDQLVNELDPTTLPVYQPDGMQPFHQTFRLKLNLALGGFEVPVVAADFPQEMRVDWVRVQQWSPQ